MATRSAIITQSAGVVQLKTELSIPLPRPDHLLIEVRAIAINPTDWKSVYQKPVAGCVVGVDYAGIVIAVPEGDVQRRWKVGDRVLGTCHGCEFKQFQVDIIHISQLRTVQKLWWSVITSMTSWSSSARRPSIAIRSQNSRIRFSRNRKESFYGQCSWWRCSRSRVT